MLFDSLDLQSGLESLTAANDEPELLSRFGALTGTYGGDAFAVACLPKPDAMRIVHHRGLNGWCEHFVEANYVRDCPVTAHIAASTQPFLWSDVQKQPLRRPQTRVMSAAADYAVHEAVVVPVRTRGGHKGNVFVRTRPGGVDANSRAALALLSMVFHSQLMTLQTRAPDNDLSDREREVLTWFAAGKSSEDVGDILGISTATVLFHYRNIACRYGTLNRTHTVVEALRRGAISIN